MSVYLIHGEDDFQRQLELNALKDKLLDPSFAALNFVELKQADVFNANRAMQTPPFGMGEKLVLLREAKFLEAKTETDEIQLFLDAITDLPDRVNVVFCSAKTLGTLKLVKELKKYAQIIECKAFNSWENKQAAAWLIQALQKHVPDIQISTTAAEALTERVGTETSLLFSECRRLSLLLDQSEGSIKTKITIELIEQECRAQHDIFKLARLLAEAKSKAAHNELNKIIANAEDNLGTLSAISTSINKYLKLKLLSSPSLKAEYPKEQQAKILGISSGRLYYMQQELNSMQLITLEKLNSALVEAERKIKTGRSTVANELRILAGTCV